MAKAKEQKSTTTGSTTSTQTTNPFAPAASGWDNLISGATQAFNATPKSGFFGDLYARPNETQKNAQSSALGVAQVAGQGSNELRQLGLDSIAGKFLDPTANVPLQAAISAGINPLREQLGKNVLAIGDAAQQAGAYGGSRQGVVEGTALRGFNNDAMNLGATLNFQDYQAERDRQLNAGSLLAQANELGLAPSMIMDRVGSQQQMWDQGVLDEALQRYNMSLEAPWAGLDKYAQILGSTNGFGTTTGTSNSTSTTAQPIQKGSALQAAAGGAAAGSAFGPWGAAIGGAIGGLGSLFG